MGKNYINAHNATFDSFASYAVFALVRTSGTGLLVFFFWFRNLNFF